MSFLDAKSYDTLFGLPELYEDALPRFSLSCEDIAFARTHRRSHNRLGFAIQLALVRDLGRTLRVSTTDEKWLFRNLGGRKWMKLSGEQGSKLF